MEYNREQYRDRSRMVLRQFTGRGAMSVKELSQMTGITENQINADRDYLREGSIPFARLAVYGQIFRAPFWAALIGPDGFNVIDANPGIICPHKNLTATTEYAFIQAKFLEDGILDHRETAELIVLADAAVERNAALSQRLRKKEAA